MIVYFLLKHLSYALHSVIGQLQTSSHQLEIVVGRYTQIFLEERICQSCHEGVESEEHYVCYSSIYGVLFTFIFMEYFLVIFLICCSQSRDNTLDVISCLVL